MTIPTKTGDRAEERASTSGLTVPDVAGLSLLEAALAYADAGWYVLPTDPANIKNPGSVVGGKWHQVSSRDPNQIRQWWEGNPDYGIALHCGRSGAIVFDLDADDLRKLPTGIAEALRKADAIQLTRTSGDRGHYVFVQPLGESFGNRAGAFASFGEVRGKNGVIIAAPTPHPDGGQYRWIRTGPLTTQPPDALRQCLSTANVVDVEPMTDAAFTAFLRTHDSVDRPAAINAVLDKFRADTAAGVSRHYAAIIYLGMGFRDAIAGLYPAQRLMNELGAAFAASYDRQRPGRRSAPTSDEFWNAARYVAADEADTDPEQLRARKDNFVSLDAYRAAKASGFALNLREGVPANDADEREARISAAVERLLESDEARRRAGESKARRLLGVNADRAMDGLAFLSAEADAEPLWGKGNEVLWSPGEGLMICGPQGVGKSTVTQQLVLARMGLRSAELFGYPVASDDRPVLYLAMDRPPQIRRSFNRMVDVSDRSVAAKLKRQLVVWTGPPPIDAGSAPAAFAEWVALHGRNPGAIVIDSLKDLATGLSSDEVGAGFNEAMQRVLASGTEVVTLHHQRKANHDNKKPDSLSDVYGSNWLTAGQGSVVLLWGEAGARSVELVHLKQPQERVESFIINHEHGTGESAATDPLERLCELARVAGELGITEAEAVRAILDVGPDDKGYDNAKKTARRKLDRLVHEKRLIYKKGARGGSGGGGSPARWRLSWIEAG